ncbi:MAG: ABC transporter substrate-binding protein [Chloroflexi bacterium]|nr:ABC transporter substrate-binding protein [Chloroflexota bacterium]
MLFKWALWLVLVIAISVWLLACSALPTPTPTAVSKQVTQPKPTAPGSTSTPSGTQSKAVTPAPAAATPAAQEKPLSPPVTVKIGSNSAGSPSDAGVYIAIEKGYFREEGLNLELVPFDSAALMIAPLSTNQLDVGGGLISAGLFNAFGRDIPVKIVADKGSVPKGFGYMAQVLRKDLIDSGVFKTDADIKGRTIANNGTGNLADIQIEMFLNKAGLMRDDVKIVIIPAMPDMLTALANKAIDAASFIEPNITLGVERGIITRWKPSDETYPNQQVGVLMYSPNFSSNLPAANRFVTAYVRGVRYYNDAFNTGKNKQEVISILGKYIKVADKSVLERMVPVGLNPDGMVNMESITNDVKWFIDHGYIKQPVDVKKVVDNKYVDYALKRLGKY